MKKLTRAGETVCVTDGGKPLWSLSSAVNTEGEETEDARMRRRQAWEQNIADLLKEPLAAPELPTLAEILNESRGRY